MPIFKKKTKEEKARKKQAKQFYEDMEAGFCDD